MRAFTAILLTFVMMTIGGLVFADPLGWTSEQRAEHRHAVVDATVTTIEKVRPPDEEPNLDDPKPLDKILGEALPEESVQYRGPLVYEPFTDREASWGMITPEDGRVPFTVANFFAKSSCCGEFLR